LMNFIERSNFYPEGFFPLTVHPINVSYLIMLGLLPREK
jgi:hypothetical protein